MVSVGFARGFPSFGQVLCVAQKGSSNIVLYDIFDKLCTEKKASKNKDLKNIFTFALLKCII